MKRTWGGVERLKMKFSEAEKRGAIVFSNRAPFNQSRQFHDLRPKDRLVIVSPHDGDGVHVHEGETAQIMGQSEFGIFELSFPSPAMELEIHFINHSQSRRADWMAKALEAAVDLTGNFSIRVVETFKHVTGGAARDVLEGFMLNSSLGFLMPASA